ncbi:Palmitoyltransferase PFA5 [Debaryomyces fabryi]|uniref:Palmitoyltransferase n=1 Tax=Debaryomyces fabryi TaxID=58627 RepID=A0A0V1PT55_9ASCO|nr:Palmitoyltransferase PFA5 [Debaryomyces fabryi]KRZ99413.1 Palmitoyltransferase PFA5 [Debaryomyces fabryi]CUM46179.1 unnamed protein product [Debaryomyces fabryi]
MVFDPKLFKYSWAKKIIPICVISGLGYIDFACFYSLGYQEIYKYHSHGVAISLWVILAWCEICVIVYWILLLIEGPGRSPRVRPFNLYNSEDTSDLTPVPDYFFCDESGYPYWCSQCQSIKLPRTLHLKDKNFCVLKFDHYCVWVGTVIGQKNYKYFLKFVIWFLMFFIVALIYLLRYTKLNYYRGTQDIDHNYIVLYILSGFWILILLALLIVHLHYVVYNMTTVDDININKLKRYLRWKAHNDKTKKKDVRGTPGEETGIRYINVRYNNTRVIVQYTVRDTPFTFGFKRNWQNLWLNNNRTNGDFVEHESSYSPKRLAISFFLFFFPYVDMIYPSKEKKIVRDVEKSTAESLYSSRLIEYEQYNEKISKNFVEYISNKIKKKEFHIPHYLPSFQENNDEGSTPDGL